MQLLNIESRVAKGDDQTSGWSPLSSPQLPSERLGQRQIGGVRSSTSPNSDDGDGSPSPLAPATRDISLKELFEQNLRLAGRRTEVL